MNETGNTSVVTSLLIGLLLLFGGTFFCTVLLSKGTIPAEGMRIAAYLCVGIACIAAAFFSARGAQSKKLLMGLLPVVILLGCLFLLAFCWREQEILPASAAAISGICLLSALVGAMPGTLLRTKRKYK